MRQTILIQSGTRRVGYCLPASIHFANRKGKTFKTITGPEYYSTQRKLDGTVILREYSNREEFNRAKDRVITLLSQAHKISGTRSGCACLTCKEE